MAKLIKCFLVLLGNTCKLSKLMMGLVRLSLTLSKTQRLLKSWSNKNREKLKQREDKHKIRTKKKINKIKRVKSSKDKLSLKMKKRAS